jgi:tol-pal system protein YbgF
MAMITPRTPPALLSLLLISLSLTGCVSKPPEQDPVVQKLAEFDGRLLRIERVLTNQSLLDLSQRIEATQNDIRTLRGKLDELQNTLAKSQELQRASYADLDKRLVALESGGGGGGQAGGSPRASVTPAPVQGGDDRAMYQTAFDLLRDSKFADSIAAFKQFMATYPNSAMADNALYWLGEAQYVTKEYPESLRTFRSMVEKFPQSRKIPDALLKIGFCNYELKNWSEAKSALNQVVQQYADTAAARQANQRLAKMESENR